jgi:hypothetical protein
VVSGGKLIHVNRKPPTPPTLALLASVLPAYGKFPFDRTLEAARQDIGSQPDPANPEHAKRLRVWLNQWLCRIGYPELGDEDVFADSMALWWNGFKDTIPPKNKRLAELTDDQLRAESRAYGDLYVRRAAISKNGRGRRVGPTAAAKLLYFVRPAAVTAWDNAISLRTGAGRDEAAFLRHLTMCRAWAVSLESEARQRGLHPDEIGPFLKRPSSSVAKLIDEWLYATITGGFGADSI